MISCVLTYSILHALNRCSIGSVEVGFFHWRPYFSETYETKTARAGSSVICAGTLNRFRREMLTRDTTAAYAVLTGSTWL